VQELWNASKAGLAHNMAAYNTWEKGVGLYHMSPSTCSDRGKANSWDEYLDLTGKVCSIEKDSTATTRSLL
jgi:hypothetical protein